MKSLFFSIFAILIIASCESSTSPDTEPEGQRIGTWMVYDTEAEWVGTGSQSKAKGFATQAAGDTTFIDSPDGQGISIWDKYPQSEVDIAGSTVFTLVDSSIVIPDSSYYSIDISEKEQISFSYYHFSDYNEVSPDSLFQFEQSIEYDCENTPTPVDSTNLFLTLHQKTGEESFDHFKTYSIDVSGMIDAVQAIHCN